MKIKNKSIKRKRNPLNNYYLTKNIYDDRLLSAKGSEEDIWNVQKEYRDIFQNLILNEQNLDELLAFLISQYIQGIGVTDLVKKIIGENKIENLKKYYEKYKTTNDQIFNYQLGGIIEENSPISIDKLHKIFYES